MSIKKNVIKIIIGIIIAVVVIVGGIFAFQFISTNMKIKETEEKLSQINAEELQTKLIKELESTQLTNNYTTEFLENKDGFIVVNIYNKEMFVEIPCFKIETDSNGKFRKITYLETGNKIVDIVENSVKKVFKNEYDINIVIEDTNYNLHFREIGKSQEIKTNDEIFWQLVYYGIAEDKAYELDKTLPTITFGLK